MPFRQIDHGDVVETRHIYLTPANQPDVVVLVRDAYDDVVEQEQAYFFRRHADGQLCNGHMHDSLEEALSCVNRTDLDPLWGDLARAVAAISMRPGR
jgi:hypothetical protein